MKYLILFTLGLLASCSLNGIGPTNESVLKEITSQPEDSVFVGTWELDSASYSLIKEKYKYNDEQVELIFKTDKTFELRNAPDFITDAFGEPVKGVFLNATGTWETTKHNESWELKMNFDSGGSLQNDFYNLVSDFRKGFSNCDQTRHW